MERAAGIAIIRMIEGVPRLLCLRIYGTYDLPKGGIEDSETELEAARRETWEEISISNVNFEWGYDSYIIKHPKKSKSVTIFLATSSDEPAINKNPVTGNYEHHGFMWLTLDEAAVKLHAYLRPVIPWIRRKLA